MNTLTMVGVLLTEDDSLLSRDDDGMAAVERDESYGLQGRIPGVPLYNDGRHESWLPLTGPAVLEYRDGVWAVEFPDHWWDRHVYRIEADSLPLADGGAERLDPSVVYEIRFRDERVDPRAMAWDLFRR